MLTRMYNKELLEFLSTDTFCYRTQSVYFSFQYSMVQRLCFVPEEVCSQTKIGNEGFADLESSESNQGVTKMTDKHAAECSKAAYLGVN